MSRIVRFFSPHILFSEMGLTYILVWLEGKVAEARLVLSFTIFFRSFVQETYFGIENSLIETFPFEVESSLFGNDLIFLLIDVAKGKKKTRLKPLPVLLE